jgi:hypothetical protein
MVLMILEKIEKTSQIAEAGSSYVHEKALIVGDE